MTCLLFSLLSQNPNLCLTQTHRVEDEPNGGKPIEFLSDYRELFDRNDDDDNNGIDAVIVCTPNFHHVKLLEELFEAAKKSKRKSKRRMHVLCEKPLCTTVADCLKVRELVKEAERGDVGDSPLFWVGMECKYRETT